jgi:hypothetical protein
MDAAALPAAVSTRLDSLSETLVAFTSEAVAFGAVREAVVGFAAAAHLDMPPERMVRLLKQTVEEAAPRLGRDPVWTHLLRWALDAYYEAR